VVKLFGKGPRGADISFELAAIASCAVHPKFLDDSVVSAASVDDDYLNFSEHLNCFVDTVEERFAADGRLQASFVWSEWTRHMSGFPQEFVPLRIAQVHFQRLMDRLSKF
jgi:hypothetical protein